MSPAPTPPSVPHHQVGRLRDRLPGGGEDAELLTAAALAVPGVMALHSGRFGEVATYLPGRRLIGVRTTAEHVEVHLVVTLESLPAVLPAVRSALTRLAGGRAVDVVVADLYEPPDTSAPGTVGPTSPDSVSADRARTSPTGADSNGPTGTDPTGTDPGPGGQARAVPVSDPRPADPSATQERLS